MGDPAAKYSVIRTLPHFTEGVSLFQVRLNQDPEKLFAIKQVDMTKSKLSRRVKREIEILKEIKVHRDMEELEGNMDDPFENIVEFIETFDTSADLADPTLQGTFKNIVLEWVNGIVYQVLTLISIKGVTLQKRCAEDTEEIVVWRVLRGILKGLSRLHKHHIFHLDLHSFNILIQDDNIKIIDFDHSKTYIMVLLQEQNKDQSIFGIPNFVAPEAACEQKYLPASDIWAAGMNTLYLCTHGKVSFDERGDPEIQLPNKYSHHLELFIKDMLNKDYTKRPNAAQLISKLTKICENELGLW